MIDVNNWRELSIPLAATTGTTTTTARIYGNGDARQALGTLVLGHGARAGQESAFLVDFSRALAALGVNVVTFNFPYTEARRRIPDRTPILEACYRAVVADVHVR